MLLLLMLAILLQSWSVHSGTDPVNFRVVFVDNHTVDLKWDVHALPADFVYLELKRDGTFLPISSLSLRDGFCRDTGLAKDRTYTYRLYVVSPGSTNECGPVTAETGRVQGRLYMDQEWTQGEYCLAGPVDTESVTGPLGTEHKVTLKAGSAVVISRGGANAIMGAQSLGAFWFQQTKVNADMQLWESAAHVLEGCRFQGQLSVHKATGFTNAVFEGTSRLVLSNTTPIQVLFRQTQIDGYVEVRGQASAVFEDNCVLSASLNISNTSPTSFLVRNGELKGGIAVQGQTRFVLENCMLAGMLNAWQQTAIGLTNTVFQYATLECWDGSVSELRAGTGNLSVWARGASKVAAVQLKLAWNDWSVSQNSTMDIQDSYFARSLLSGYAPSQVGISGCTLQNCEMSLRGAGKYALLGNTFMLDDLPPSGMLTALYLDSAQDATLSGNLFTAKPQSSLFSVYDSKDWGPLVKVLQAHDTPVARFLWDSFTEYFQEQLRTNSDVSTIRWPLVQALNHTMSGPPMYEAARFAGVTLSGETSWLVAQEPEGEDLIRLHRLLLEDAYSSIIIRNETQPGSARGMQISGAGSLVSVRGNQFAGLYLGAEIRDIINGTVEVRDNVFQEQGQTGRPRYRTQGLSVRGEGGVAIHDNCFALDASLPPAAPGFDRVGLSVNSRSNLLDVSGNWWGDPSGPRHSTNPGGLGWAIDDGSKPCVQFQPASASPLAACADAMPSVDVSVAAVEMTQVVEGVPELVAGKPLAVKAVLQSVRLDPRSYRVHLDYAGSVMNYFYVLKPENVDVNLQLRTASNVLDFASTNRQVVYFFPITPPTGTLVTARVTIDPYAEMSGTNRTNNTNSAVQRVVETVWDQHAPNNHPPRVLRVWSLIPRELWNSDDRWNWCPRYFSMMEMPANLFPLPPQQYRHEVWPQALSEELTKVGYWPSVYEGLAYGNASRVLYVGVRGSVGPNLFYTVTGNQVDLDGRVPMPEEGAHCGVVGLGASYMPSVRGPGSYAGSLPLNVSPHLKEPTWVHGGIDVAQRRILDSDLASKVAGRKVWSICGTSDRQRGSVWIDQTTYTNLLWSCITNQPRQMGGRIQPSGGEGEANLLLVSGKADFGGNVILGPVLRLPFGALDSSSTGDCAVVLRDALGRELQRGSLGVSFAGWSPSGPIQEESAPFAVRMPWNDAMAVLEIEHQGEILLRRTASAHAPTVTLLSPNGGEQLAGTNWIVWQGQDADGDTLRYTVLYSPDAGESWWPLAVDITETQWNWDTKRHRGGPVCLVTVLASDGILSAYDASDNVFSITSKPPLAVIVEPVSEAVTGPEGLLTLRGMALDYEDGLLTNGVLQWSSDRDGHLGSGRELQCFLSQGTHVVTLQGTDSGGLTGQDQIVVRVEDSIPAPKVTLDATSLSVTEPAAIGQYSRIGAQIRSLGSSTSGRVRFVADNEILAELPVLFEANKNQAVWQDWLPKTIGSNVITVSLEALDPPDNDPTDNTASRTVTVVPSDADDDGLPNWWEERFFSSEVAAKPEADPDEDGMTNLEEYGAGTLPNWKASVLKITDVRLGASGEITFHWQAVENRLYRIWTASDLASGFHQLGEDVLATNSAASFSHRPLAGHSSYYRVSSLK